MIKIIKRLDNFSNDEIEIFFRREDIGMLSKELFFKVGEIVWPQLEKIFKHQALLKMSDRKIRESLKIMMFSVKYLDAYLLLYEAKPPHLIKTTRTLFEWWLHVGQLSDAVGHVSLICGGLRTTVEK